MLSHHTLDRAGGSSSGSDDDAWHRTGALAFFARVVRVYFGPARILRARDGQRIAIVTTHTAAVARQPCALATANAYMYTYATEPSAARAHALPVQRASARESKTNTRKHMHTHTHSYARTHTHSYAHTHPHTTTTTTTTTRATTPTTRETAVMMRTAAAVARRWRQRRWRGGGGSDIAHQRAENTQEGIDDWLGRVREEAAFSEAAEPRVREPQGRASSVKRHCANNAAH